CNNECAATNVRYRTHDGSWRVEKLQSPHVDKGAFGALAQAIPLCHPTRSASRPQLCQAATLKRALKRGVSLGLVPLAAVVRDLRNVQVPSFLVSGYAGGVSHLTHLPPAMCRPAGQAAGFAAAGGGGGGGA